MPQIFATAGPNALFARGLGDVLCLAPSWMFDRAPAARDSLALTLRGKPDWKQRTAAGRLGAVHRWMYRGRRPRGLAALTNRWTAIAGVGRSAAEAPGHARGAGPPQRRLLSFPVVMADYEGERYLVSMLGEQANWVRNVRAAGGRVVLRHGRASRAA